MLTFKQFLLDRLTTKIIWGEVYRCKICGFEERDRSEYRFFDAHLISVRHKELTEEFARTVADDYNSQVEYHNRGKKGSRQLYLVNRHNLGDDFTSAVAEASKRRSSILERLFRPPTRSKNIAHIPSDRVPATDSTTAGGYPPRETDRYPQKNRDFDENGVLRPLNPNSVSFDWKTELERGSTQFVAPIENFVKRPIGKNVNPFEKHLDMNPTAPKSNPFNNTENFQRLEFLDGAAKVFRPASVYTINDCQEIRIFLNDLRSIFAELIAFDDCRLYPCGYADAIGWKCVQLSADSDFPRMPYCPHDSDQRELESITEEYGRPKEMRISDGGDGLNEVKGPSSFAGATSEEHLSSDKPTLPSGPSISSSVTASRPVDAPSPIDPRQQGTPENEIDLTIRPSGPSDASNPIHQEEMEQNARSSTSKAFDDLLRKHFHYVFDSWSHQCHVCERRFATADELIHHVHSKDNAARFEGFGREYAELFASSARAGPPDRSDEHAHEMFSQTASSEIDGLLRKYFTEEVFRNRRRTDYNCYVCFESRSNAHDLLHHKHKEESEARFKAFAREYADLFSSSARSEPLERSDEHAHGVPSQAHLPLLPLPAITSSTAVGSPPRETHQFPQKNRNFENDLGQGELESMTDEYGQPKEVKISDGGDGLNEVKDPYSFAGTGRPPGSTNCIANENPSKQPSDKPTLPSRPSNTSSVPVDSPSPIDPRQQGTPRSEIDLTKRPSDLASVPPSAWIKTIQPIHEALFEYERVPVNSHETDLSPDGPPQDCPSVPTDVSPVNHKAITTPTRTTLTRPPLATQIVANCADQSTEINESEKRAITMDNEKARRKRNAKHRKKVAFEREVKRRVEQELKKRNDDAEQKTREEEKKKKEEENIMKEEERMLTNQKENAVKEVKNVNARIAQKESEIERLSALQQAATVAYWQAEHGDVMDLVGGGVDMETYQERNSTRKLETETAFAEKESIKDQIKIELKADKEEQAKKKQELIEASWNLEMHSSTRALRYSRECYICTNPNPLRRSFLIECGHIICTLCAEQCAEKCAATFAVDSKINCPFCQKKTKFERMYENVVDEEPVPEKRARVE